MSTLLSVLTKPYDCLLAICAVATGRALLLQALRTGTAHHEAASSADSKLAKVRFDSRQTLLHAASQPDSLLLLVERALMSFGVHAEDSAS